VIGTAICLRSRANTQSGHEAASFDFDDYFFHTDSNLNPLHNWNHVYMKYCDGASFSGGRAQPIEHKGVKLWWRGKYNFEATITDLLTTKTLANATTIILGGCSAGGLATWLHADRFADRIHRINPLISVSALPDSGFFPDYQGPPEYHKNMQWVYATANVSAGVNEACVRAHPTDDWKCMFAEHMAPFVQTPTLVLQSAFDAWDVPNDLGSTDRAKINQWGYNRTVRLVDFIMGKPQHALFLTACYTHCFFDSGHGKEITIAQDTVYSALREWVSTGVQKSWVQDKDYPCADCCVKPRSMGVNGEKERDPRAEFLYRPM